jgi:hypothetical protein
MTTSAPLFDCLITSETNFSASSCLIANALIGSGVLRARQGPKKSVIRTCTLGQELLNFCTIGHILLCNLQVRLSLNSRA